MTNITRLLALAFFAFLLLPTLACVNLYHGYKYRNKVYKSSLHAIEQVKEIVYENPKKKQEEFAKEKAYLDERMQRFGKHESLSGTYLYEFTTLRSDYASFMMHLGNAQEAIKILEDIIQKDAKGRRELYNMIANLGTAYELTGQNEKALQYIKKGLELNKESHAGSEWIHVKILEAKIALQTNPNWLKENEILGKEARQTAQGNDKVKIKQLIQDLGFQLFERTQFIQPKDAMVGDLIMFLGDLYKQISYYEYAIDSYKLAEKYTVSKPEVLQTSLAFAEQNKDKDKAQQDEAEESVKEVVLLATTPKEELKRSPLFTTLVLAGLAVLVGGVWLMYFRGR